MPARTIIDPADYIGTAEAGRLLHVSALTVRRAADDGTLRAYRSPGGGRVRVHRDDVEALLTPGGAR